MKGLKIFLSIFIFGAIIFATSCTDSANSKDSMEYTSAYICPMHCKGSGSAKAGTCPVCKMDYVANTRLKRDVTKGNESSLQGSEVKIKTTEVKESTGGHNHDSHEGHDHDSHEGHNH